MTDIIWQDWFEVGHDRIDSEHKTFFDILRAIDFDIRHGTDKMRVLRVMNELRLYTYFHFISEENLMEDCSYPDIKEHRRGHKIILETMDEYITDIRSGIDRFDELLTFLYGWFCGHTVNEDSKLSQYIKTTATT